MLPLCLIKHLLGYNIFRRFVTRVVTKVRIDEVREAIKDEIVDFSAEMITQFAEEHKYPQAEVEDYLKRYRSATKRKVNQRFNGVLEGIEAVAIRGRTGKFLSGN